MILNSMFAVGVHYCVQLLPEVTNFQTFLPFPLLKFFQLHPYTIGKLLFQFTVEDPHNKYTIEDQSCLWTTPLKNCLSAVFKLGFNKSYILEIRHLKNARRMELRK